mmetsp:Transcript_9568/g.16799  ORF Transcript_9568/g.16799 Transcript_9568/m.16799 type:complete len:84 (+) Transcript_9568:2-253(+)
MMGTVARFPYRNQTLRVDDWVAAIAVVPAPHLHRVPGSTPRKWMVAYVCTVLFASAYATFDGGPSSPTNAQHQRLPAPFYGRG